MRWGLALLLLGMALTGSAQIVAWSSKVGSHTDESGGALSASPHLMAGFTSAGSMTLSRLDPVTGALIWRSVAGPGTVTAVVQESVQRVHLFGTTPSGTAMVYTFDPNDGNLLERLDLGDFRIEWVRRDYNAGIAYVFGKNGNNSDLLSFDMRTGTVIWSRTGPMIAAHYTYGKPLLALEAYSTGYRLQTMNAETGAIELSRSIPRPSERLSKIRGTTG